MKAELSSPQNSPVKFQMPCLLSLRLNWRLCNRNLCYRQLWNVQEFVVGVKVCYGVELAQIAFRTALWARKASHSTEAGSESFGSGFKVVRCFTLTRLCTSKHHILENSCVRGLERIHLFNTRSLLVAQPCLICSNMHYEVVSHNPRDCSEARAWESHLPGFGDNTESVVATFLLWTKF